MRNSIESQAPTETSGPLKKFVVEPLMNRLYPPLPTELKRNALGYNSKINDQLIPDLFWDDIETQLFKDYFAKLQYELTILNKLINEIKKNSI